MLRVLSLALLLSAPKDAVTREAERLAHKSIIEYNVGDFEAALEDVTAAYKVKPVPGLLFNLGQCHRALHHWEKAEFSYRGYLREKPEASNREAVEQLIGEMQQKRQEEEAGIRRGTDPASTVTLTQVPLVVSDPVGPTSNAPKVTILASRDPDVQAMSVEPPGSGPAPVLHDRSTAYVLGGLGIAGLGLAAVSAGEMVDYQSYYDGLPSSARNPSYRDFASRTSTVQVFNVLVFVGAALAVVGAGGAALTW